MDIHLETERLLIRPFRLEDVEVAYAMNADPEVVQYTGDGGVVSMAEMRRRIEEDVLGDYQKYGFGRMAVEWKATGEFIGFAGLKYLDDLAEVDLGYRFLKAFWGKGIATEAAKAILRYGFDVLGLKKIIGLVLPENAGSIRVLEKLHFTFEKDFIEDGHTIHQYALYHKP